MNNLKTTLKIVKNKYFSSKVIRERQGVALEFYTRLIPKSALIFDVGANIGDRVALFNKLNAKTIAVEPQSYCVNYLKTRFKNKLIIENVALGEKEGVGEIYVSNANTLSSMSKKWIDKMKEKRFKEYEWNKKEKIQITTLDKLIEKHGLPYFCKIDVEGYEFEVLKGLTKKIKLISFEYALPEATENIINCINHLSSIGTIECNFVNGESFQFGSDKWLKPGEIINQIVNEFEKKLNTEGDIYVRYLDEK